MITEQELKKQCTPEFIKWMCEYAEGFEFIDGRNEYNFNGYNTYWNDFKASDFPLLIHRAIDGFNKIDIENQIRIDGDEVYIPTWEIGESSCKYFKKSTDYKSQFLTQSECAMLHCLLDVFKQEEER